VSPARGEISLSQLANDELGAHRNIIECVVVISAYGD
jgi:hypothetical protein